MSARYWVLASDELMASDDLQWPEGLRLIERGGLASPGMRWWKVEDDGAPATLEGKAVELTFVRCADKIQIGSRNPAI